MGDGIDLMGAVGKFRVHALKPDVPPIVLTGTDTVEGFVVNTAQQFPAINVFPDPLGKLLLDEFLPVLGNRGFLFVEDRLFFLPFSSSI